VTGGIFSAALSVGSRPQALPGTLPNGARTFLHFILTIKQRLLSRLFQHSLYSIHRANTNPAIITGTLNGFFFIYCQRSLVQQLLSSPVISTAIATAVLMEHSRNNTWSNFSCSAVIIALFYPQQPHQQ